MRAVPFALLILAAFAAPPAAAQSPDAALSAQWNAICAGASGQLSLRCAEIFAGGPGARDIAATGNALDEIPGQGRAATRDGAPDDASVVSELAAGWSLFASADSGRLKRRDGTNEAPFDGDTGSLSAGIDWMPAAGWQLGLVLNHARDELDFLDTDGEMSTRFTGLMLVAGWLPHDAWSLDGYAGRLDGDYDVRRSIEYSLASGIHIDAVANASMEATRDLAGAGVTFMPATGAWQWQFGAGVDWQSTTIDPYREDGGNGFAISVPGREVVSRRGRVDVALSRTLSTGWGVWQPTATLGGRHEFANPSRPVRVTFLQDANATPVVFETDDADTTWGEMGLGAVFVFAGGHSAFVEYRQRFGHDFLQERILSLGWRMEL
jgi:outer membrane autotransporter protein